MIQVDIINVFKSVFKCMRQVPIYNKKQNYHLVLNYCKHNLKENYSCIFQFYTLDE